MFLTRHPELKITFTQAQDEAREHDHPEIGLDHLVVAMLTNVRGQTYRILTEHDLDYETASARLIAFHDEHPGSPPTDERLDRDRDALHSIGIDLDAVRDAVKSHFGVDITDDWDDRRTRRGPRRGHRPHRGGRGMHDGPWSPGGPGTHHMHGGGRRGPRSQRARRPGFTPALQQVTNRLGADLRSRFEESGRAGAKDVLAQLPLIVLAATLHSDDPTLAAVLGDVDRGALLRDVEEQITVSV